MDYATQKENEGQSGLTLGGDHDHVQTLSVKKFHFSEDYQSILQRQLDAMDKVVRLAQGCSSEDEDFASNPAFFAIALRSGGNVYAEAFLEDGGKYSSGYTVFALAAIDRLIASRNWTARKDNRPFGPNRGGRVSCLSVARAPAVAMARC